jgi:hypothetical protein
MLLFCNFRAHQLGHVYVWYQFKEVEIKKNISQLGYVYVLSVEKVQIKKILVNWDLAKATSSIK